MCGITGIVDTMPIDATLLKKTTDLLKYRGPDAQQFFIDTNVGFGHNRLAIIDIKGGRQPMETEGVVLSFNGQIYNFRHLRSSLEKKGVKFDTDSDTEVLLKLFIKEKASCFPKLNGMFAFSIWDSNSETLYLARDRSGIKPLYYAKINNKLIFGSEIKCILGHPEFQERAMNLYAFHLFFNLRYVPEEHTFFKGIYQLKAGQYLIWQNGKIEVKNYWVLPSEQNYRPVVSEKLLKKLLINSIDLHLISDVEIGSFLSGGIDSSTMVALASKRVENLKTFTLGFNQDEDELEKARLVAEHYNTDHYEKIIPSTFLDDSPLILWHAEFPKRNVYGYYVAKFASEKVKVVLSGLGSDELFGGYTWKYKQLLDNTRFAKMHSAKIAKIQANASYIAKIQSKHGNMTDDHILSYLENLKHVQNPLEMYTMKISLDEVFNVERRNRWYGESLKACNFPDISSEIKQYFTSNDPFHSIFKADFFSKMIGDFLHIDDRMCMANSLEARIPFLENNLIDFSFATNPQLHLKDKGKYLLRQAMKDELPKAVLDAPKHGFTISLSKEYIQNIIEYSKLLLVNGHIIKNKLISKDYIEKLLKLPIKDNLTKHYYILWNLLYFEIWYEIFMERKCKSAPKFKITDMIK